MEHLLTGFQGLLVKPVSDRKSVNPIVTDVVEMKKLEGRMGVLLGCVLLNLVVKPLTSKIRDGVVVKLASSKGRSRAIARQGTLLP